MMNVTTLPHSPVLIACEQVDWAFRCNQRWEGLQLTEDQRIRYCQHCKQCVYLCDSLDEISQHSRKGHCVAFADSEGDEVQYLGEVNTISKAYLK